MPEETLEKPSYLRRILSVLGSWLSWLGFLLIVLAGLLALLIFYPVIKEEIGYLVLPKNLTWTVTTQKELIQLQNENPKVRALVPVDENFGIIIPKISANASVIPQVDSQNPAVYQKALTRGVAHARNTALPNENGNIFIFAHSSADFWEASKYNAIFYLLSKLEKGDKIYLFYQGRKYTYAVSEKKTVEAAETSYLEAKNPGSRLTLMTCWPPGTTLKRLLVLAQPE